jgi:hypothetical protein
MRSTVIKLLFHLFKEPFRVSELVEVSLCGLPTCLLLLVL